MSSPVLIIVSILFYILQTVASNSSAFEVYINDELVFSKLKEGRFLYESVVLMRDGCYM